MEDHKKFSGAQFRKISKENQAKRESLLAQTPKLDTYFTISCSKVSCRQTNDTTDMDSVSVASVPTKSDEVERLNIHHCAQPGIYINVHDSQHSEKLEVDPDLAKWVINDAT